MSAPLRCLCSGGCRAKDASVQGCRDGIEHDQWIDGFATNGLGLRHVSRDHDAPRGVDVDVLSLDASCGEGKVDDVH